MEKLEHPLLIVEWVNALLGPLVVAALRPLGIHFEAGEPVIPDYVVMCGLIVVVLSIASAIGVSAPAATFPNASWSTTSTAISHRLTSCRRN